MKRNCRSCAYCHKDIDMGDWSPYTSKEREVNCANCKSQCIIEWGDDEDGWHSGLAQLSKKEETRFGNHFIYDVNCRKNFYAIFHLSEN